MTVTLEFQGKKTKLGDTPEQAIQTMTEATEMIQEESKNKPVVHSLKLSEKRERVSIKWSVGNSEFTLSSLERPAPEMLTALDELLDTVIDFCKLDGFRWNKEKEKGNAFVSGVNLKHDGGIAAVITAQLKDSVDGFAVVINTPFLKPELLTSKQHGLLQRVEKEAISYINGGRAQLSLFDQEQE